MDKNERLARVFSKALQRAPLVVPIIAGGAREAVFNPTSVLVQEAPQIKIEVDSHQIQIDKTDVILLSIMTVGTLGLLALNATRK